MLNEPLMLNDVGSTDYFDDFTSENGIMDELADIERGCQGVISRMNDEIDRVVFDEDFLRRNR